MVFRTEAGSLTQSGLSQPAFLNFDAELMYPPAHHMQVMGSCLTLLLSQSRLRPCLFTLFAFHAPKVAPLLEWIIRLSVLCEVMALKGARFHVHVVTRVAAEGCCLSVIAARLLTFSCLFTQP